mmetsp:Transcript_8107/g.24195  ORF Transcript_8107/g.24195 Transcript_8107/m.24195 type:complete len:207 (-) Transcript_8107:1359-1979(-)
MATGNLHCVSITMPLKTHSPTFFSYDLKFCQEAIGPNYAPTGYNAEQGISHSFGDPSSNLVCTNLAWVLSNFFTLVLAAKACRDNARKPARPTALMRGLDAAPATFSSTDASRTFSVLSCVRAILSRAFSFSSDRTRILSDPLSMARSVSSMYSIFLGEVMAVSTSLVLSPVALRKMSKPFATGEVYPFWASVNFSMNGWANFPIS